MSPGAPLRALWKRLGSGGLPGLQNRRLSFAGNGVFDSHALPPNLPLSLFPGPENGWPARPNSGGAPSKEAATH
jgi:hypothetical protein